MKIAKKILEKVSQTDLDRLESLLDKLFKSLNIDIEFTRHFLDRVNDPRNKEDITTPELADAFGALYKKYGKQIKSLPVDTQAVLKDIRSDINIPFVIDLNSETGMLELISKTVMRKKNFMTSNSVLKVGEMKLAERILNLLNEKIIKVNNGKKFGQVVIAAGGAGSGKGFALQKFMDIPNAKTFDVDALKSKLIKLAKAKGDKEIASLDLRNPQDVFKLHQIVKKKGIADKEIEAFLKSASEDKLPNIIFDKTAKDKKDLEDVVDKVISFGYQPEDIHLVWILTDYKVAFKRNIKRSRVVPRDVFLQTHRGAAKTMQEIVKGGLPKNLDGEIYVILNNSEETVEWKDKDGNIILNTQGSITPDSFTSMKLKDSKGALISDEDALAKLTDWINKNVPKSVISESYSDIISVFWF